MLAPVVLIAVAAAIVLVISGSLSDEEGGDESTQENVATTDETGCAPDADQAVKDGYYVVKEGDNFTTIAAKTCISVQRLQGLNPNLDSFGLQPDNCVDLVPNGCKKLASG